MSTDSPRGTRPAAIYRDDPRLEPLIGPGAMFEVEPVVIDGVPLRDFVRAPKTVLDVFDMGTNHADLVHVVYQDERHTFGQVRQRALSTARELQDTFGVRAGDRVAICMRNLPEYPVAVWAAALCGAIVTPMNSWWVGAELAYAIDNAGARVVVLDHERVERLLDHGRPEGVTLIGVRGAAGDVAFEDLVGGTAIEADRIVRLGPDDIIAMLFTSGTTGHPKGALLTNRGMMANVWNMAFGNAREALISGRPPAPARQPASLSVGPLFHIGGMTAIFSSPMGGAKLVFMHKWELEESLRLAREENITQFGGVPTMVRQVLDRKGVGGLGLAIQGFPMGGAAVPPDLPLRAVDEFGAGIQLLNGYGLTETTSAVVTNVGAEFLAHPTSVGRPNLTADLKIVDPEGVEVDTDVVGEICFRSPQVVKGYWNNPEANEDAFVDGWFHSGDLGYVDDDGYLYVVDRLKDVVIRGGENVYCAEVEAALYEHPAVASVAVVGVEEQTMGERVCAVVVTRDGMDVDLDELRRFARERLAGFKIPEALVLADSLPETATGKIDKKSVRANVADEPGQITVSW